MTRSFRASEADSEGPAELLAYHLGVFERADSGLPGPILDLACGGGRNGLFLAAHGLPVIFCDQSRANLQEVQRLASAQGNAVELWQVDLEPSDGSNPLPVNAYGAILVFRYLHRPLISCIRKALRNKGVLIYETFTVEQPRFGKPHHPNFLLKPGELFGWFRDWKVIYYFEGVKERPRRAVAQIVCQKHP
jgi:tellurite methyltransferase